MKTIIIFCDKDDDHVQEVLKFFPSDREVLIVSLDKIIREGYSLTFSGDVLQLTSSDFILRDSDGEQYVAWLRKPDYSFYFSPSRQFFENQYLIEETSAFFENVFCLIENASWLNRPWNIAYAKNRILQMKVANALGLNIIPFAVTNLVAEANSLLATRKDGLVIKRLGNNKIIVPDDLGIFTSDFRLRI